MDNFGPPPAKRPRRFFIEELLAPQVNQQGAGNDTNSNELVQKLSSESELNTKFGCMQTKSRFSIQNVPADPEELIAQIIQSCVDQALADSRAQNLNPDNLGCTISSPLLNNDIWIPIRAITADTVNSIMERFLQIAQSKEQEGITLWGEPFTVTVTTLDRSALVNNSTLSGGARTLAPVHHRIYDRNLIKIQNPDERNYCLFYALMATLTFAIGKLSKTDFLRYKRSQYGQKGRLLNDSLKLMRAVKAPPNKENYDAEIWSPLVIDHWNNKVYPGRHVFKVFVFDSMGHYKPSFTYGPEDYSIPILLYYDIDAKHFHGVQKTGNLFGQRYCLSCEMVYDKAENHRKDCKARCSKCSRMGPGFPCKPVHRCRKKCQNCKKSFSNYDCFKYHLTHKFCEKNHKCVKCGKFYDVEVNTRKGRAGHVCNERYCKTCKTWHDKERGCFIEPLEPKNEWKQWRLVAFDLETMQHELADPSSPANGKRKHVPNFICAKVACPTCIGNGEWKKSLRGKYCKVCGDNRTITFSQEKFNQTVVDKQVISRHPLVEFVKWILYQLPLQYDTVAISHFGGRFDMILTFRELFLEGYNPTLIRKGNRLFEMSVERQEKKNPKVTFRDSWNLIPAPLASLVPMFGLDVEDKPFFPHLANRPDNYGRPIFPKKEDYLAGGMMPTKRKEFDKWYTENKNKPFVLEEALASYCTNDVEILMSGLISFRQEFRTITRRYADIDGKANRAAYKTRHEGIDPIRDCVTIASACMKHYRTNHLPFKHLARVPENGYDTQKDNQSVIALKYMDWYAWKNNVQIQTAQSKRGEKKIGKYKADGWIEEQQKVLEVHGCPYHACPKCYPRDEFEMMNGKTAGKMREEEKERMDYIKSKVPNVEVVWTCEIEQMKKKDSEMRKKFAEFVPAAGSPLNIRDCFMGGRTGAWKLFHKVKPGEKISYYDFTSLYPFINYTTDYPIGHPKLHVLNQKVNWDRPEDNPYRLALLKVFLIPPRKIDVPVMPIKVNERLCFPTCIACCKKYPQGGVIKNYKCKHSDKERGWISSCTSIELNAALAEGYKVTDVYRVLEYEKSDNSLFRAYIREFYQEKLQSSGFDESVRGNRALEEQFIKECKEMFDILIDRTKMVSNKGRRALAKLCLNNLWGRFSLRNFGLSKTLITANPAELGKYMDDPKIELSAVNMLTPESVLISYVTKKEWVEENDSSNVVLSLFTTSAARLHLLKSMQKVVRTPGCTLLYTDTDSLIFVHPIDNNPLELGPHLGQFTDEFPNHDIVEFCSGGSKQYGLKLRRKNSTDEEFEYILKVRGMTLNHDVTVNQGLRYETFRKCVLTYAQKGQIITIPIVYPNFLRPSVTSGSIVSTSLSKIYKPFVGSGIVCPQTYSVRPFGFTSE